MIHPVFRLIAAEPQMVTDHLSGYCDLLGDELRSMGTQWSRRVLLQFAAVALVAVSAALAGVALMLWAAVAAGNMHLPWLLVAVPLIPLLGALVCQGMARDSVPAAGFAALREQLASDARMLREAGST